MVQRYDAGRLDRAVRTPSGGVRVPAMIGRTGVQAYRQPDGTMRREYRPPDEVFSADSLASLAGAPVTVGHPGRVTPQNWKRFAVGQVSEAPPARTPGLAGEFIAAPLAILDGDAIAAIDSGDLAEVSAGYDADLDMTPGIAPGGEKYDAVQRNVRYNHVAIGPRDWARAGREARLTLDGNEDFTEDQEKTMADPVIVTKIVLDGVTVVEGSPDHIALLVKRADAADARAKAAEGREATATARADAEKLRADGLAARDIAADVAAEIAFRADAVKVLGAEYAFQGKTRRAVQLDMVAKLGGTVRQDASDDFVAAYLAGRIESLPKGHDYNAPVKRQDGQPPAPPPGGPVTIDSFDAKLAAKLSGAFVTATAVEES